MKKCLSIVIVNYDTNELTVQCLKSIEQTRPGDLDLQIIIVDNASPNDDPSQILESFPDVNLIVNDRNLGFGVANNIGISRCTGDYILLLNSDTILHEGCLKNCTDFLASEFVRDHNINLIGCNVKNEDGTDQYSIFKEHAPLKYFFTSNALLTRFFFRNHETFDFSKSQFVSGVSGCFMMFKIDIFSKVKPFDPDFFMYSEEVELCRNRLSKYAKIYYYSGASITHLRGKSSPKKSALYLNMLSFALYRYKMGWRDYLLYCLATFFNIATLCLLLPYGYLRRKSWYITELQGYLKILPYIFFQIPRYPRSWGSRPQFLKFT
ncbi:glycosyltransferase family 2 protein [Ekhidna sp.]|uniref:glycosyltransferase family 2 protein n=1 Tax=Ekhidna sp. TaxID=2608089 RepID=UPI003B500945